MCLDHYNSPNTGWNEEFRETDKNNLNQHVKNDKHRISELKGQCHLLSNKKMSY